MRKLLILLLCLSFGALKAQEVMKVRRAAAIDRNVAIKNVYVNEKGNRWVADTKGVFLVQSPEFANPIEIGAEEWSLLNVPDGNEELNFPKADMKRLMGDDFAQITTAHLDKIRKELWVGTKNAGVYHFKTNPSLELIETLSTKNSKLRSNAIQTIMATSSKRVWIGSYDGLLLVEDGKEKAYGKFFSIEAIANYEGNIWVVSDGEVLVMDRKGDFYAFEIAPRMVEGKVKDIAFDSRGNLWIASEIVVRYHFDTEKYDLFGPAQEFTSQFVNCIAVDQDDALWVGTNDKGVYYIGRAASMTAELILQNPLSCEANAKNAALKVLASGGKPPYTYNWSGGIRGENPKNLGAGTYSVTISDQSGNTVEAQTTIQDNSLVINISQQKPASLGGNADGHAAISVTPENAKYTFKWDNGEQNRIAKQLNTGDHQVTVTGENGCTSVATVTITEALAPLSVALEQTKGNNCQGAAEAELKATTTGGQGPYVYKWNQANLKGAQAIDLSAGDYQITVTDAAGNTATAQISLNDPKAITASISPKSPATTNKADGKAKVSAEGGSGKFTYRWDTNEATETAEKLTAGTHTVTITDEAGCSTTATIDINEDILPLDVELVISTPIKCAGENSAALTAKVSGGKAPFQYKWSAGNGVSEIAPGLAAGKYQLTVTDAEGNTKTADANITEPKPLSLKIKQSAPASTGNADGQAKVSVDGGTGDYDYTWDNGEANATATTLTPGIHKVTVLDKNGCGVSGEIEITENILALNVNLVQKSDIKCSGEQTAALAVEVVGGKPPYQYQWSTNEISGAQPNNLSAGDLSVTVTDASGLSQVAETTITEPKPLSINVKQSTPASTGNADGQAKVSVEGGSGNYDYTWDNGEANATATRLTPGLHKVTVLDKNGCGISGEIDITENILALNVNLVQKTVIKCFGEKTAALAVEVQGGKPPYQYQWNTSDISGAQANNLTAGDFAVTVTDASGLNQVAKATITEPQPLTLKVSQSGQASTGNADGQAKAVVAGGSGNYDYTWDNGEATATATKLTPGIHKVTVLDKNGCGVSGEIDITENIIALSINLVQTSKIKCFGEQSAALAVEVQGGKPPYQYKWNASGITGAEAGSLGAGDYAVTVTDASGLSQQAQLAVSVPDELIVALKTNKPATNEDSKDGKASLTIKGGTAGYTVNWDNGETGTDANALPTGAHSVSVTDANGCSASLNFETGKKIMPDLTAGRLRAGQTLQVSQIYFEADSTNMTADSYPVLNEIADFLEENPLVVIEVGGHTNNQPPHEYCDNLSTARAKSAALHIVKRGIDPSRVVYKGYGKREPKYSNATSDGRRKNQRVEVKILRLN
ncbi:MAG: hypothetical protein DHS20C18_26150 [Saprospiraceae bacterium]|nr:MAG: hypothetical protein DHS20C18_26150 [Saprospiraceae bacterium]